MVENHGQPIGSANELLGFFFFFFTSGRFIWIDLGSLSLISMFDFKILPSVSLLLS